MSDDLYSLLSNLGYFQSSYDLKTLIFLINNSSDISVKELTEQMNIPDSKIYPAVNKLTELGLIQKNSRERPNKYYLREPEYLISYLQEQFDQEIVEKRTTINLIKDHIYRIWNPEDNTHAIANLFKGRSIFTQIIALQKQCQSKMVYILAPTAIKYAEQIVKGIETMTDHNLRIELAIPDKTIFYKEFESIIASENPLVKLKQSQTKDVSYIISDRSMLLNITHQGFGDVAYLTNDQLLVEYLDNCWYNQNCSTPFPPNFTDHIDLPVSRNIPMATNELFPQEKLFEN